MKFRYIVLLFISFLFLGCGNILFKNLTSVFIATFESNGGSPIDSFEASTIKEEPKTTKDDCSFDGWFKQSDFKEKVSFPYSLTEDTKFYAKWMQKYLVTFETNGGTPIEAYKTARIDMIPFTTKENCILVGWYTSSDFSGEAINYPFDVKDNITLYAKWIVTYNISFETNGGSQIASYKTAKVDELPVTIRDGYSFCGWYMESEFVNKVDFPYTLLADTVLYAKWQKKFTVNFNTQGGSSIPSVFTGYIESIDEPTKLNKDFAGWYLDSDCTESNKITFPYMVTSDVTFYAKWIAQQVYINFYPNGADSGSAPNTVSIDKGSDFLIPGNTGNLVKTGYVFTKWNTKTDGTGINYLAGTTISSLNNNLSLYAQWGKDYGTMIFINGGTFIMGEPDNTTQSTYLAHEVTLSDFYIAQYELTYEIWQEIYSWAIQHGYTISNGFKGSSASLSSSDNVPVTYITWDDAAVWCNAYSEYKNLEPVYYLDGEIWRDSTVKAKNTRDNSTTNLIFDRLANGYRLPTEAEWEYAAGGGSFNRTKYAGTNSESYLKNYAWYWNESTCHSVGGKLPNKLNLYDMSGNVAEWTFDWYWNFTSTSQTNPANFYNPYDESSHAPHVLKGGTYESGSNYCIVYQRLGTHWTLSPYIDCEDSEKAKSVGFRVARNAN